MLVSTTFHTQIFHSHAWIYSPTLPANEVHQTRVLHEAIDVAGQIIPCNFLLLACHPFHEVYGGSTPCFRWSAWTTSTGKQWVSCTASRRRNNSNANSTVTGGDHKEKKKGPSAKNLMAKRGCQRKLNDRLYMPRSVIPKVARWTRHWWDLVDLIITFAVPNPGNQRRASFFSAFVWETSWSKYWISN